MMSNKAQFHLYVNKIVDTGLLSAIFFIKINPQNLLLCGLASLEIAGPHFFVEGGHT